MVKTTHPVQQVNDLCQIVLTNMRLVSDNFRLLYSSFRGYYNYLFPFKDRFKGKEADLLFSAERLLTSAERYLKILNQNFVDFQLAVNDFKKNKRNYYKIQSLIDSMKNLAVDMIGFTDVFLNIYNKIIPLVDQIPEEEKIAVEKAKKKRYAAIPAEHKIGPAYKKWEAEEELPEKEEPKELTVEEAKKTNKNFIKLIDNILSICNVVERDRYNYPGLKTLTYKLKKALTDFQTFARDVQDSKRNEDWASELLTLLPFRTTTADAIFDFCKLIKEDLIKLRVKVVEYLETLEKPVYKHRKPSVTPSFFRKRLKQEEHVSRGFARAEITDVTKSLPPGSSIITEEIDDAKNLDNALTSLKRFCKKPDLSEKENLRGILKNAQYFANQLGYAGLVDWFEHALSIFDYHLAAPELFDKFCKDISENVNIINALISARKAAVKHKLPKELILDKIEEAKLKFEEATDIAIMIRNIDIFTNIIKTNADKLEVADLKQALEFLNKAQDKVGDLSKYIRDVETELAYRER